MQASGLLVILLGFTLNKWAVLKECWDLTYKRITLASVKNKYSRSKAEVGIHLGGFGNNAAERW